MKISLSAVEELRKSNPHGIKLPTYDIAKIRKDTFASPAWVHFGAGNIFRAFIANAQQTLLNEGLDDKGIIVAEGFDYEIIDKCYTANDNLSMLSTLMSSGSVENTLIASVTESLKCDRGCSDFRRLEEIFRSPALRMVSFTITEKGYALSNASNPDSVIYKLTELVHTRFKANSLPLALVSMDNCSKNGVKLKAAVLECAKTMSDSLSFLAYLEDPSKISFPCSMIDKITPRPDESVRRQLSDIGIDGTDIVVTSKNTYSSSYVNAEECEYLVIEDKFPAGRPPLEKAGIIFTDGKTVDKTEKMKVCTCLNPLHTALAVFGCLLGFDRICDEMNDTELSELVKRTAYNEGLPVVCDPGIISPEQFLSDVLTKRLPNPFMPDTPQRIACDTSQKLPIRFGETIKAYAAAGKTSELKLIPLILAGWCRYLMGINDEGKPFELSPDPMLSTLCPLFDGITLGCIGDVHKLLTPILSDSAIFGIDLYTTDLGVKTEAYFEQLSRAPHAVRKTLQSILK